MFPTRQLELMVMTAVRVNNPACDESLPQVQVETAPSRGFYASVDVEHNDRDPAIAAAVRRAQAGDMEAIRFLYLRY